MATLTYDFEQDGWYATIRIADSDDGDFEDPVDATPEQLAALKAALPEGEYKKIEDFKEKLTAAGPRI